MTTFNTPVPLVRGTAATDFNQLYYRLPDARYAIYGITSFYLPKSATTVCSTILINSTLNSINSFTVTTPNTTPQDVLFVADIFTVNTDNLCNPGDTPFQTLKETVGQKSFFTIPTLSNQQYIVEDSTAPIDVPVIADNIAAGDDDTFNFQYFGAMNGNNDTILFQAQIPFVGVTPGAPLRFEFGFFDSVAPVVGDNTATTIVGNTYVIQLAVNGFIIYQTNFIVPAAGAGAVAETGIFRGFNADSSTINAVITISYRRSLTVNQNIWTYLRMYQYTNAYDPTTGCCPVGCPANTGLDVQINPPTCVYCNAQAGLVFNPNNGTCTCISGFYLDPTQTFQCYPCTALYCAICNPANPAQCTSCVVGATLNNVSLTCTCGTGFFVNVTTCQQCPYQCQTCSSPLAVCTTCVDPLRRDVTQNCRCITGFFDTGAVNCTACSPTCRTCTNASACTSCDPTRFRNLTGTVCSCMRGYYELYHTNLTRTCERCNPECLTCQTSPALCTSCDASKNRVAGVDNTGRQTCLCLPGFYSTPDGSCVQANCNADPFCAECEQGLKLCIKCLSSQNRVIKLPESICVCMDGYYPNSNNTCVPCTAGCGICSSATVCSSCVALASPIGNGGCSCPAKTYFTVSPDMVRYCAPCGPNCVSCVDANTCTTCATSYTKTADNRCVCALRNFVDAAGTCLPCPNGCQNCTSLTACNSCTPPLLLQGTNCQISCNDGFTALGSVCLACPAGCQRCTESLTCYYCRDGWYEYKGGCYQVCPAGTIGDSRGGNWKCVPCNEPCKTCINHPSYCTSCLNGMGYLQTSANMQSCVLSCVPGTYASEGVCQVCDFRCATCLGSASNCLSCPDGQILYKGGCWAVCPAIQLQAVGMNASCVDNCPDGYFKLSATECSPCSIQCTTCEGGPSNCTSCLHGSVSVNGTCVTQCGENEFNFQGVCVACSESCYGCANSPQNCLECASGYVKTGSICEPGCLSYQFFETRQKRCISCGPGCATCSSYNYCTSCQNPAITPRSGVCSSCPYPCATCDGAGACTSCLSGFYYFQGSCQTTCPVGASPVNGICQCSSGIVSLGQCVSTCGSGFTAIDGSCQPCNPNCADCSGSVNACTRCISGFSIDSASRRCVSQIQCPYGQDYLNGVCTNICEPGFLFFEGMCLYGQCFPGYSANSVGGCVRQTNVPTPSGPSCNPNQFISNGVCVGTCGNGLYPDSTSRRCVPCGSNCDSCFNANFCIVCSNGFETQNGNCIRSSNCEGSQLQFNGRCVARCPVGTFALGSQCLRSCSQGLYAFNQICYPGCPTGLRTNEACVTQCPAGTTNQNGVCL